MEKNDFLIPLNGLASGKTVDILDADLRIEVEVEKSGSQIDVGCHIAGRLTVTCDRCLGDLMIPLDSVERLRVKFGDTNGGEESFDEDGRETVLLSVGDTELDMKQVIYDYACLSIPLHKVHADGECDPEVTAHLGTREDVPGEFVGEENPFAALKDMLKS